MKPARFTYFAPDSAAETIALLARFGDDARLLAGGQSMVPLMNLRVAKPTILIDLNGCRDLAYLDAEGPAIVSGPMTRQDTAERSEAVRRAAPLLSEALGLVGHQATRNRGTLGGSIAHADPAAELPGALVALGADMVIESAAGRRIVAAEDFFLDGLVTALEPGELLREIRVRRQPPGSRSAFVEFGIHHGDLATAGIAAVITLDAGGICRTASLVAIGVGPRPMQLTAAQKILQGTRIDTEAIRAAAHSVTRDIDPPDNMQGTAAYRLRLATALTEQALQQAMDGSVCGLRHAHGAPRQARAPAPPGPDRAVPRADAAAGIERARIRVSVNGRTYEREVEPRLLLSDFLRHTLHLTGTHVGCGHGVCGACTVMVNGATARSCLMFAVQADGASIGTVEGLARGRTLHPVQQAFHEEHALQCGYCTPGFLITVSDFLAENPAPSDQEIKAALGGNLCRCTGYVNIVRAVRRAAETLRHDGAADAPA